jgi:hypothetical protein
MKSGGPKLSSSALKMHMLASTSQLWEVSGIQIEETDDLRTDLGREVAMAQ